MFTERYGKPYRIIAVYRKEIKHWAQIKAGNADTCQKFQNVLVKLENIGHLQTWNVLDTIEIMCILWSKLSKVTRGKWSRNFLTICIWHNREPDLTELIHFFNDETLIVYDSVLSRELVVQNMDKNADSRKTSVFICYKRRYQSTRWKENNWLYIFQWRS